MFDSYNILRHDINSSFLSKGTSSLLTVSLEIFFCQMVGNLLTKTKKILKKTLELIQKYNG